MFVLDLVGDMLCRIVNAQIRKKDFVTVLFSKYNLSILSVLEDEGYLSSFSVIDGFGNRKKTIEVELKYFDSLPVIKELKRISKPGRRVYVSADPSSLVSGGFGINIISTSKGVFPDYKAFDQNLGGEVICKVF